MVVTANGKVVVLDDGATVADLLATMGLTGRVVAVEHNHRALLRSEQGATNLAEGDTIEIVRAVAGG